MSDYRKKVEQAKERWADDPIEINAAREQEIYNKGFAAGRKSMLTEIACIASQSYFPEILEERIYELLKEEHLYE